MMCIPAFTETCMPTSSIEQSATDVDEKLPRSMRTIPSSPEFITLQHGERREVSKGVSM